MGDDDRGGAAFAQDRQRFGAHGVLQPGIEAGKGLVHQKHGRARRKGAGQRHALLLAAGKHMREGVRVMLQPDAGKRDMRLAARLLARQRGEAEADVVEDGEMREQREILEHQPDRALLGRQEDRRAGDLPVVQKHAARRSAARCRRRSEQRRLAGAGRAEQAEHLAGLGGEADICERLGGAS